MGIVTSLFTLWLIIAGIALILKGPEGMKAVAYWPPRTIARLARSWVGKGLVSLGKFIQGK